MKMSKVFSDIRIKLNVLAALGSSLEHRIFISTLKNH